MSVIDRPTPPSSMPFGAGGAEDAVGPSTVRVRLFGPIEVRTATRRIGVGDFPSRKAKQACELLVSAAGQPVSKDQLIDVLWGDKLPRNPSAAVDHTISLLRSVLVADDGSQSLVTERGRYRIDLSVADIDLVRFTELVDWSPNESAALPDLLEAIELVQGQVLEDEMYSPWAETVRERYRHRVQRALLDVARTALAVDQPNLALSMAERAREDSEVVLEEAFALGISALMRLGRRHDARVLMLELEHRMATELGADLAPETVMLRSMLQRAESTSVPARVAVQTRLTEPMTVLPFCAREAELATINGAIDRALDGASEMVLVQGPPGIGKTRLLAAIEPDAQCPLRSISCLPSDADHPLYVVHRLVRMLERTAGLPRSVAPPGETVHAVFDRLTDLFDQIGPTVVTIDDIHFADPASLAVVSGLTRPHAVASLVVVAAREHTPSHERDRCDLARARSTVIELGPLPRSSVDALPIDAAWDETGGHPGLLVACVDANQFENDLCAAASSEVLGWIGPSGSPARVVLGAAAQIGARFQSSVLAGRVGLCGTTTNEVLTDLIRRHLIRLVDGPTGLYAFRADLLRRVLCESDCTRRPRG